jgi:hypothetical protein
MSILHNQSAVEIITLVLLLFPLFPPFLFAIVNDIDHGDDGSDDENENENDDDDISRGYLSFCFHLYTRPRTDLTVTTRAVRRRVCTHTGIKFIFASTSVTLKVKFSNLYNLQHMVPDASANISQI